MSYVWELQHAVANSAMASTARHIVLTLAIKANWETGVIPPEYTPALSTIAAMTGYSRSTVAEWLVELETAGWIKREQIKGSKTRYSLLIGSPQVTAPERASRRSAATKPSSPPGGHPPTPSTDDALSGYAGPPGGQVRPADTISSPPGGTEGVRPADTGSPPGGPATKEISPTERSTSGDIPQASARTSRRTAPAAPARSGHSRPDNERIPLPADFHATAAMIAWCREKAPNVGRLETEAFVDYWRARNGSDALRNDVNAWVMLWRNWMRQEQKKIERSPAFRGKFVQTAVEAAPARPRPDDECPLHFRQRADNCVPCRSERIEAVHSAPQGQHWRDGGRQ